MLINFLKVSCKIRYKKYRIMYNAKSIRMIVQVQKEKISVYKMSTCMPRSAGTCLMRDEKEGRKKQATCA